MNAPDIAKRFAQKVRTEPDFAGGMSTFTVLGPNDADSTSFVMIGTYVGGQSPDVVYRVSVERVH